MKAIIDIAHAGQVFDAALADLAAGGNADYVLRIGNPSHPERPDWPEEAG